MIEITLSDRAEKIRSEIKTWLKSNRPPALSQHADLSEFVEVSRAWQRKLAEARWVAVHWPEQYGGRGLSLVEEAVIQEELGKADAPQLINLFGLTMVGPVLIEHGSAEQQQRFLQKILLAEEIWCQGFSEPQAGSDLASLKTQAVQQGSNWSISGQKVWTSFAQYAQFCFVLARSDQTVPKHKGLTYFLVDMKTPGISVRPLTQISGDQEFNEVFFEDVKVPGEMIVGKPGDGWKIAISTLMYERVILTFARHLQSEKALAEIVEVLNARGATALELDRLGRLIANNMAVRTLALSHLVEYSSGKNPGPEGSLDKLFWSENFQEISKFALEILGSAGVLGIGDQALSAEHRYLYSRGRTIAAGTSEIQRGIIAERVLGLPKGS
ncbi:acyl-CoA dehydrogenase family protein [bacterium]|nr:acyl-CoA dehydrogenase family protein [bacterium]